MATHPDVLVVGGGVIGLTCAYLLAKSGLKVEVVDKGEMGREASWAGAGILPPWGNGEYATPLDHLRAFSVSRFADLSAELRELTGINNEYYVCGGFEYLDPDDFDQPELWRREGIRYEVCRGIPAPADTDTFYLTYAQVRNPRHLKALIDGCCRLGVRLRPNSPFAARMQDKVRTVVFASGAWAEEHVGMIGVHPVLGQMVLLGPDPRTVGDGPVQLHGKRYLVPRRDGRVLVGSTEEPETGFTKRTTDQAVTTLLDFATSLRRDLSRRPVEAVWSGLRPGSRDGLPYIGRVAGFDNVIVAAGHFRAGIQTSIGTAECVRALILGEPPPVPLEAFAPGRTPHPPMRTAFRS